MRRLAFDGVAGLTLALLAAKLIGLFSSWQWQLIPYATFAVVFVWYIFRVLARERTGEVGHDLDPPSFA